MKVIIKSEGKRVASFTAATSKGLNKQQKEAVRKLRNMPQGFGLWSAYFQNRWLLENGLGYLAVN